MKNTTFKNPDKKGFKYFAKVGSQFGGRKLNADTALRVDLYPTAEKAPVSETDISV